MQGLGRSSKPPMLIATRGRQESSSPISRSNKFHGSLLVLSKDRGDAKHRSQSRNHRMRRSIQSLGYRPSDRTGSLGNEITANGALNLRQSSIIDVHEKILGILACECLGKECNLDRLDILDFGSFEGRLELLCGDFDVTINSNESGIGNSSFSLLLSRRGYPANGKRFYIKGSIKP